MVRASTARGDRHQTGAPEERRHHCDIAAHLHQPGELAQPRGTLIVVPSADAAVVRTAPATAYPPWFPLRRRASSLAAGPDTTLTTP